MLNNSEKTVMRVLNHYGPATDSEMINRAKKVYKSKYSPSGLRTRRKELVARGLVRPITRTRNSSRATVWGLTSAGKRILSKAA